MIRETTYQDDVNPAEALRLIFLVGTLALALGGIAALISGQLQATAATTTGEVQVVYREHAVKKHAEEAVATRNACESNGVYRRFRSYSPKHPNKFYEVCQLPDGRFGLRIVRALCRTADGVVVVEEATSFIPGHGPGKGSWKVVRDYVTQRAGKFRWPLSSKFANLQLGLCN